MILPFLAFEELCWLLNKWITGRADKVHLWRRLLEETEDEVCITLQTVFL